jgi:hypothetical protein
MHILVWYQDFKQARLACCVFWCRESLIQHQTQKHRKLAVTHTKCNRVQIYLKHAAGSRTTAVHVCGTLPARQLALPQQAEHDTKQKALCCSYKLMWFMPFVGKAVWSSWPLAFTTVGPHGYWPLRPLAFTTDVVHAFCGKGCLVLMAIGLHDCWSSTGAAALISSCMQGDLQAQDASYQE